MQTGQSHIQTFLSWTTLRVLLLSIVASATLGCGGSETETVAQLKELGALVVQKGGKGPVESVALNIPGRNVDLDKALPLLANLRQISSLNASGLAISDDQLQPIGKLKSLVDLQLADTKVTNAGLKHLTGLSNLGSLYLDKSQVTAEGLSDIGKITSLKVIGLNQLAISGGVKHLEKLENLTLFIAGGTEISDEDAAALVKLPKLSRVDITGSTISAAALGDLNKKFEVAN